jgi:hypothetical protein
MVRPCRHGEGRQGRAPRGAYFFFFLAAFFFATISPPPVTSPALRRMLRTGRKGVKLEMQDVGGVAGPGT